MRFVILIIAFIFFSQPSYAKWGKGPLKLSKETMEAAFLCTCMVLAIQKYSAEQPKEKTIPSIMAISEDGTMAIMY